MIVIEYFLFIDCPALPTKPIQEIRQSLKILFISKFTKLNNSEVGYYAFKQIGRTKLWWHCFVNWDEQWHSLYHCCLVARKSWVWIPVWVFLHTVSMFYLYMCGFSVGAPASCQHPETWLCFIGLPKLLGGRKESVCVCRLLLVMCVSAPMDGQPVQGVRPQWVVELGRQVPVPL